MTDHLAQFVPEGAFDETIHDLDMVACAAAAQRRADDEGARLHSLYAALRGSIASISRRSRVKPSSVDMSAVVTALLGEIIAAAPIEKRAAILSVSVKSILGTVSNAQ